MLMKTLLQKIRYSGSKKFGFENLDFKKWRERENGRNM